MSYPRVKRVAQEIKKEISDIIMNNMKDPRLTSMVSITRVDLTKDFKYAKVYLSIMGSEEETENSLQVLKNARGYIRKELGKRMKIRHIPELEFIHDRSVEYSIYIENLIKKVNKDQEE
ncbi:MAG: 30S ribosome-binding factor RbfA [Clostridia bacterium]|nr:30S ribosome-binding factor RbfA [Clostridia bacterium]